MEEVAAKAVAHDIAPRLNSRTALYLQAVLRSRDAPASQTQPMRIINDSRYRLMADEISWNEILSG